MFKNIGGKIKGYAIFVFIMDVLLGIGCFIASIVISSDADKIGIGIGTGILLLAVCLIWGYLSVIFIYGYGELIESTMQIRDQLCGKSTGYTPAPPTSTGYTSTPLTSYGSHTSGGSKSFGVRSSL